MLNHANTPELKEIHDSINWREFGEKCLELCERYSRKYYIKADLRKEMEERYNEKHQETAGE